MALLLPAEQSAPGVARRMQCTNNMKQIALALHNYGQVYKCFPPAYIADKNGKPMHSWRVLILPYLEGCESLYKQYNFNEPWDGPNNKKLLAARPAVFRCPGGDDVDPQGATETSYVAVVGAQRGLAGREAAESSAISRRDLETIMVVEAADAGIQWTEPKDLSLDALEAAGGQTAGRDRFEQARKPQGFLLQLPLSRRNWRQRRDGRRQRAVPSAGQLSRRKSSEAACGSAATEAESNT